MPDPQERKTHFQHSAREITKIARRLALFQRNFVRANARARVLIAAQPMSADGELSELLESAEQAVEHAVQQLRRTADKCAALPTEPEPHPTTSARNPKTVRR